MTAVEYCFRVLELLARTLLLEAARVPQYIHRAVRLGRRATLEWNALWCLLHASAAAVHVTSIMHPVRLSNACQQVQSLHFDLLSCYFQHLILNKPLGLCWTYC